jgi:hypothetical protein
MGCSAHAICAHGTECEFYGLGLAQDYAAGTAQPGHEATLLSQQIRDVETGACGGWHIIDDEQVFDANGHTHERSKIDSGREQLIEGLGRRAGRLCCDILKS